MRLLWSLCARARVAFEALRREDGQTFTEYAMIVAVIAVGTVAAVGTLRDAVTNALTAAANGI
jgi:Flp pilus assembly pilin Flp